MPPTRWLSMSASVVSLMRSQLNSTAFSTASARSRYSRSVITTIVQMQTRRRIVGWRSAAWGAVLALALVGCGQKGPLTLPTAAASSPSSPSHSPSHVPR
ncbi:LPS translocon maturation chaperone LptM [Tepidimonas sp. HKU78]|uniref:LPS translocon maturation chaperone LptM n=2 Tax=unclassified Tepidimonas TaxID=2631705 RepID=UPI003CEF9C70